ncbi:MAG: 6-bladed beta-propeller [Prolixibacteraceae bacterium]
MRGYITFFLMLVGIFVAGQTKIIIPEPYGDNFIESELISNVSFVPLQLDRLGVISPDMELKVDGEDYFILENRNSQCVYHFGSEGELLNTICEQKPAQEADNLPILNNPAKFSLNPYLKQIEIYNFENSIINRFSYDGKSVGKLDFGISPSDFVRDNLGNYWVYMGWHNSESQYRLIKADQNGKVIDRKMRLISNSIPFEGFAFYINNNDIYFWETLGNTVYAIEKEGIVPKYLFDFGSHNLPLNYHMLKGDDSFKYITDAGYYTVKKYVGNDDFDYLFLNYTSNQQREMFHVIHDKKAEQIFVYTENSAIGAFDKAQSITAENELVFLVSPRKIRQLLSGGTEFVPAPFMNLVEGLGRERNPVILKIQLKSFAAEIQEAPGTGGTYFEN